MLILPNRHPRCAQNSTETACQRPETRYEQAQDKHTFYVRYQQGLRRNQYAWSGHQLSTTPDHFVNEYDTVLSGKKQFSLMKHQLDAIGYATNLYHTGYGPAGSANRSPWYPDHGSYRSVHYEHYQLTAGLVRPL